MMRETPRTFVGSVVFVLEESVGPRTSEQVRAAVAQLPGITLCELDPAAGSMLVTAERPVDRTDVIAVLDRFGCRVRA